jgi:peptidoglycan/LPS O-acetylase OafA/YrhL
MSYWRSLLALDVFFSVAAACSDYDHKWTGDVQSRSGDGVLDGVEGSFLDENERCVVNLLQTSIKISPESSIRKLASEMLQQTVSDPFCLPSSLTTLRVSTYVYLTFFIMVGAAILTFLLSKPGATSPNVTKSSKCPNLDAMDSLRVVFISSVIQYHFSDARSVSTYHMTLLNVTTNSMNFFMIFSGFLRVITSKTQDPDVSFGQGFRHHVARLLARFCPAYYLALALTMMIGAKGGISILAPIQALFLQGTLTARMWQCLHLRDGLISWELLGQGWFVADIFILATLSPCLDKILQCVESYSVRALLLVSSISLPFVFWSHLGYEGPFVGQRGLQFMAGMISAQMVKDLPDWIVQWTGWRYLFDCSVVLLFFKLFFVQDDKTKPRLWAVEEGVLGAIWCLLIVSNYCETVNGSRGFLSKILGWRPLASLGVYSFAVYIYQFVVRDFLIMVLPAPYTSSTTSNWLIMLLVWAVAVGSEKFMEAPVRRCVEARMKGSLTDAKPVSVPATPGTPDKPSRQTNMPSTPGTS